MLRPLTAEPAGCLPLEHGDQPSQDLGFLGVISAMRTEYVSTRSIRQRMLCGRH